MVEKSNSNKKDKINNINNNYTNNLNLKEDSIIDKYLHKEDEELSDSENLDIDENNTSILKNPNLCKNKKLFVILEHANLELHNVSKFESKIMNSEDIKIIKKLKKNKEDYRPDITFHVRFINI